MAERTGEGWWQPELYRLRGELKLLDGARGGAATEAEADFNRALDLARAMSATALEERAALSLQNLRSSATPGEAVGAVASVAQAS